MPLLKVQPRRGQPQGLQVPPPAPPHISNPGRESSTHFLFPTRAKRTLLAFPGASWPRRIKSFAPGLARTPARLGAAASGRQIPILRPGEKEGRHMQRHGEGKRPRGRRSRVTKTKNTKRWTWRDGGGGGGERGRDQNGRGEYEGPSCSSSVWGPQGRGSASTPSSLSPGSGAEGEGCCSLCFCKAPKKSYQVDLRVPPPRYSTPGLPFLRASVYPSVKPVH